MIDKGSDVTCFDYIQDHLDDDARDAYEGRLLTDRKAQNEVMLTAMLAEMVKEYALVCAQDSFRERAR